MLQQAMGMGAPRDKGVGVDLERVATFADFEEKTEFIAANFTQNEIERCLASPDTPSSFAGRWAAKEAVVKALSSCSTGTQNLWKSAGAPLRDIEVLPGNSAAPVVTLSGHAKAVAEALGVGTIKVSISHSDEYAVAQAVAI